MSNLTVGLQMAAENAKQGNVRSAWLLEEEIERRELQPAYLDALSKLVDPNDAYWPDDWQPKWLLLRATSQQRAQAFLIAIGETTKQR